MDGRKPETIVLKIGGSRLRSPGDLRELADYVTAQHPDRVVVVHGGGPEISELHQALGIPFEKRDGLRVTSDEGMHATVMALCGCVNKRVVASLVERGLPALGLSGVDLGLMRAGFKGRDRWGRVGTRPRVDAGRLERLLAAGLVPVISPVSLGPDGQAINVNADEAAHALAEALGATTLELVSDVPGVRLEHDRVAERIAVAEAGDLIQRRLVRGGMVPKLRAAVDAVSAGVDRVRIGDLAGMAAATATVISDATRTAEANR